MEVWYLTQSKPLVLEGPPDSDSPLLEGSIEGILGVTKPQEFRISAIGLQQQSRCLFFSGVLQISKVSHPVYARR